MKSPLFTLAALTASLLAASATFAEPPAPGTVHVRGTIQSLKGGVLTVNSDAGPVRVQVAAKTPVVSVIPSDRAQVKEGAFLGIASVPGHGAYDERDRCGVAYDERHGQRRRRVGTDAGV